VTSDKFKSHDIDQVSSYDPLCPVVLLSIGGATVRRKTRQLSQANIASFSSEIWMKEVKTEPDFRHTVDDRKTQNKEMKSSTWAKFKETGKFKEIELVKLEF
jgi:hypothetical protein